MLTRCLPHMCSVTENRGANLQSRRHVDGSFTSDVNKVLDSIAAKEYLQWVMNSKTYMNIMNANQYKKKLWVYFKKVLCGYYEREKERNDFRKCIITDLTLEYFFLCN
uniref:Glucagon / GIP / secretin / VIP family domain-containing protein n=1 Tax=Cyprinus carpio TaxID=7962 RepID=A0A8C2CTQ5_CYPCA